MTRLPILAKWLIAAALAACWLASIGLPAVDTATPNGTEQWSGSMILEWGWMAVLMGQFGWFANIVLPAVLLLTPLADRSSIVRKLCIGLALLLLLLTLNAMMWREIPTDHVANRVIRFRIGYYLWMGAMVGGAVFALASTFWAREPEA